MAAETTLTLWQYARIGLRVLWRAARQLFHEATGVFFALFAVYGGVAGWREYKYHSAHWLIGFATVYAAMMAAFAFFAFRRARRIR